MTDARPPRRIVSLVPSGTETLLALGADVVACTRFCEQPTIEHVGGTKNPDIAAIGGLAPDLVVVDREENRIEDHDALLDAGLDVFVSHVTDVDGAFDLVDRLAAVVGAASPRRPVLENRPIVRRRSAFVPIWRRPWMTISASTYGASVLDRIGIDLTATASDDPYPTLDLDEVGSPDVVLVPSEPYDFSDHHLAEISAALPGTPIVRVDGRDLFWWGTRTAGAINRLAAALAHPPTR